VKKEEKATRVDDTQYGAPLATAGSNEAIRALLCDVLQLLDGWHQDGTAWTKWDESVRRRVSAVLTSVAEKTPMALVRETAKDIDFAVDMTEPEAVRLARFRTILATFSWKLAQASVACDGGDTRGPLRRTVAPTSTSGPRSVAGVRP
jgi:hypothetical protein